MIEVKLTKDEIITLLGTIMHMTEQLNKYNHLVHSDPGFKLRCNELLLIKAKITDSFFAHCMSKERECYHE